MQLLFMFFFFLVANKAQYEYSTIKLFAITYAKKLLLIRH